MLPEKNKFTKFKTGFAFKAANGKYLSLDEKSMTFFANAEAIGVREKFKLIVQSN